MSDLMKVLCLLLCLCGCVHGQLFETPTHKLTVLPRGAGAGQTGQTCYNELAANGSDQFCLQAADDMAATLTFTLPAVDAAGPLCSDGAGLLTWGGCGDVPVIDTTSIAFGSDDNTKQIRFEVDGLTTATVRALTVQDADYTLAGTNIQNTFTQNQFFVNDTVVYWGASDTTPIGVMKLNGSNHFEIGPLNDITGTPDVWFYKDGVVAAKLAIDSSNSEISFIPSTDQDRQIGAYPAMWQRIIGLRLDAGRSTSTTEVQGTVAIHTGVAGYSSPSILKGITDATQFPTLPVLNAFESAASFVPSQDNVYVLGSDGLDGGGTGAVRRWAEAHIVDLFVGSCSGCGGTLPVDDATAVVKGSGDPTKFLRFEVDGFTTSTTRTLTPQNASYTIAGVNISNTFSASQYFNNDTTAIWKDTAAADIGVLKLNGSNHVEIGHLNNAAGTPDVFFYKDGSVVAKLSTDASNSELSFIPSTDQDRQIGAFGTLWQRIIGLNIHAGRSTSTTEVQGTFTLHTGVAGYTSQATLKGITDATQFPSLPVLTGVEVHGSLVPSQDNTFVLGSNNLDGASLNRRWAEAHVMDLAVYSNATVTVGSGNFYQRYTGASSGISCSGVAAGWFAITSDNYVVWCDGSGNRYRAAGSSY